MGYGSAGRRRRRRRLPGCWPRSTRPRCRLPWTGGSPLGWPPRPGRPPRRGPPPATRVALRGRCSPWTARCCACARPQAGPVHLVAAYDQTAAVVVGQVAVDDGDEIAALPAVCDTLDDLQDVLVSADALHCQRSHATYLVGRGAHYVLTAKGNQRRLRDALARQPWATVPGLVQYDVGHGRRETRSIKVISTDGQPQLAALFPHAAQIAKIVRRRRRPGRNPTVQTVYLITSLTHRQATPERLAGFARGQWTIENGLHWVRDVTQGEDRCRVRTGSAPQNLAAVRNTVISLFRFHGHNSIAEAHRIYADQPHLIAPTLHAA